MPRPAFESYRDLGSLADRPGVLNLSWTLDERSLLTTDIQALLCAELRREIDAELDYLDRYLVQDPYGDETLGASVARYFSRQDPAWRITCGAGVIGLLAAISRAAANTAVLILGETYPDFPYWLSCSCACPMALDTTDPEHVVARARASDARFAFLERPGLIADPLADLGTLAHLCDRLADIGVDVVIDESNANYHPPSYSATGLVPEHPNLAVLRGFSKAYGLGALRLAYCVSAPGLADRLRRFIPPLETSSLSLRLGRRVLEAGDSGERLRTTIERRKAILTECLTALGFERTLPASKFLPYVLLPPEMPAIETRLVRRGIRGKLHALWPGTVGEETRKLYRLSAPLLRSRLDKLIHRCRQDPAPARHEPTAP